MKNEKDRMMKADNGQGLTVRLPRFEGPLDLLLYLIRREEIDIFDIPINDITRQYLAALGSMRRLNLEVAGEFILMVAYLLHIKAQMLLPHPKVEEEEDPRQPLVQKLLEYQKFKIIGEELKRIEIERQRVFPHGFDPSLVGIDEIIRIEFSPFDLYQAYLQVLRKTEAEAPEVVERPAVSIEELIAYISRLLAEKGKMSFLELVKGIDRFRLVAIFIALLELARQKSLRLRQGKLFGTITISATADVCPG